MSSISAAAPAMSAFMWRRMPPKSLPATSPPRCLRWSRKPPRSAGCTSIRTLPGQRDKFAVRGCELRCRSEPVQRRPLARFRRRFARGRARAQAPRHRGICRQRVRRDRRYSTPMCRPSKCCAIHPMCEAIRGAGWDAALNRAGLMVDAACQHHLRMDFAVWTERMQTPKIQCDAIRALQCAMSESSCGISTSAPTAASTWIPFSFRHRRCERRTRA